MEKLFQLLDDYTEENGSWSLERDTYKDGGKYDRNTIMLKLGADEVDFKNIDIKKPIYCLYWYQYSWGGRYTIFSNSLNDILKQVLEIVEQLKKEKEIVRSFWMLVE